MKEEVVLGQEEQERTEKIRETKRETELEVERGAAAPGGGHEEGVLSPEDEDFQQHFRSYFSEHGEDYQGFREAYRYGSTMSKHSDKEWPEVEEDLHHDWDKEHPGTWNRFREAIHYGWDREHRQH